MRKTLLPLLIASTIYLSGCRHGAVVNTTPCILPTFPELTVRFHACQAVGVDAPFDCMTPQELLTLRAWMIGVFEFYAATQQCPLVQEYTGE